MGYENGGRGGIRTHGGREPSPVFKTGAFNRSATRPEESRSYLITVLQRPCKDQDLYYSIR